MAWKTSFGDYAGRVIELKLTLCVDLQFGRWTESGSAGCSSTDTIRQPRIDVAPGGFDIRFAGSGSGTELEVQVVDVRPRDRHLLLLVRNGDEKSKFLCGHDARH